jgi:hypothetical protein
LEFFINSPRTKEKDIQNFLEINPEFLFALDENYCEIKPHVCLIDRGTTQLVPDFMARIEDSNIWDIIELKLPIHPILVTNQGFKKPSAIAARGISQLLKYRDFFSLRNNRGRFLSQYGIHSYEPTLILVIGRGYKSQNIYEWTSVKTQFPKVKVVTYDYLFNRAKQLKVNKSKLGDLQR